MDRQSQEHLFMVVGLLLSLVIAFGAAVGFIPALRLENPKRSRVFVALCIPIFLAPLVVPQEATFVRFVASVCSLLLWMKVYDLHLDAARTSRLDWRPLLAFLLNWGSMVLRTLDAEPRPTRRDNWVGLALSLAAVGASVPIVSWLFRLDWSVQPFAIEHGTKVVALFCALVPAGAASSAIWRLGDGKTRDWFNAPFLSRTPADFWRRYNRPVQQFFREDIFRRVGGFRSPARATLVTFAISGLVHEYVFGVATGRVQGYQMIFFLINGCAVAATLRARPRGWQAVPWIAGTVAFNLASSVFFFASLNAVVPFYSRGVPEWLTLR
ncbi:MAG TPA: MBOAT family O-acyltransferase [Verrucomicrobiae bacterium]|nr:MBOAT family O-acyltransferase [Verrucomicrobiae bacterium]